MLKFTNPNKSKKFYVAKFSVRPKNFANQKSKFEALNKYVGTNEYTPLKS